MTIGEQLYLALVLLAFFTFAATLAVVSSRGPSHATSSNGSTSRT